MILRFSALLALAAMADSATAQTRVTRHASTPPALILQGVTVMSDAKLLLISGQVPAPIDSAKATLSIGELGRLAIADFGDTRTQTISALARIKAILAGQGLAMGDVVKLNVFLAGDPKLGGKMDFAGMNEGFRTVFGTAETPVTVARTTIQVAGLAGAGYLVEIEAIAAR